MPFEFGIFYYLNMRNIIFLNYKYYGFQIYLQVRLTLEISSHLVKEHGDHPALLVENLAQFHVENIVG